jgi:hypothetical protein
MVALDEATLIGGLPHWKAWAGGAPCIDDFRIRPWPRTDPFEKIENQRLDGVGTQHHHGRSRAHDGELSRRRYPGRRQRPLHRPVATFLEEGRRALG